ncbi:MAG: YdiU family protein [Rhodobacteraceae bacterium]|nr:YdiU family protein [Paracoccaceae bacterium]
MTLHIPFDNSFAALPAGFHARLDPTPVKSPSLIAFNAPLAEQLGLTGGDTAELAQVFSGNTVPEGAEPLAQLYAGHQFGHYNPQLGDGRAILLGETLGRDGVRRDIQLKGSGRTPFSRSGDGRAWLGPVLREYIVSEAMAALGVPTTRALAAVRTGEQVYRETVLPGAVLTRVAKSHLRVGTFQVFSARQDLEALHRLFDYTVARHYPTAQTPADVLRQVIDAQARLVAQWMSFGFIHGVMNTDNCAISGETIDYGPCAFLDAYHPETVFSSIDRQGRYAYGAQADVIVWNMAQFATALVPLCADTEQTIEEFTQLVRGMPDLIRKAWLQQFGAKIGLAEPQTEDAKLIMDLLARMSANQADFTNTFRALGDGGARDQFTDPSAFDDWQITWTARLAGEANPDAIMAKANPVFIPRNHRIEQMITAAVDGDDSYFHHLHHVLSRPFDPQPDATALTHPPLPDEVVKATFCGT